PGGNVVGWLLLVAIVTVLTAALVSWLSARRRHHAAGRVAGPSDIPGAAGRAGSPAPAVRGRVSDAALRDLAARAASGDGSARRTLSAEARDEARDILAEDRFHAGHHHEGILHRVFVWLGDRLEDAGAALPGGNVVGWLLLVAIVTVLTAALVSWLSARRRRRAAGRVAGPSDIPGAAALGPAELERRATEAELAGDLDTAVRLRFAAGLLRLDDAHAIALHPSLTSGDVGRLIHSPRYDDLATTHDAIAYGGHHAASTDAAAAREDWPAVVGEARRR
ncbi:MAG TPA: DUF4129 domain-containing protein, partial [Baekduia sp.]|nr:DUF4129 domain-containing protein [Baekduia sp.]